MSVRSEVENLSPAGALLEDLKFRVWMGGHLVGQGSLPGPFRAAGRSRFTLEAPVWIAFESLPADLPERTRGRSVRLRVEATFRARTAVGSLSLRAEREGDVQVAEAIGVAVEGSFRSSSVSVIDMQPESIGLTRTTLRVRLRARNVFAFPIRVLRARCSVEMDGRPIGDGGMESPLVLPPRASREVDVSLEGTHGSLGHGLLSMLGGDPVVHIRGTFWIDPVAGVSRLPVDIRGSARAMGL
jgi:hypothetical protein